MNVTPAPPDRIGRAPNQVRDVAAGLVLHPEEQRAELQQMAATCSLLGPVGRDELLDGLKHARADWAAQAESTEKSRALKRMDGDVKKLESLQGNSLTDLSSALLTANHARQDKLGLYCKLGIGVALGGFFLTMVTGHWACLAVGGAGVATAATAAVKRYQTPERDTLSRLATYGAIAQQRTQAANEVKQLVDGLGSKRTHGVRQTDTGVQVGGVILKRRQP
jgi:hypothetical protein